MRMTPGSCTVTTEGAIAESAMNKAQSYFAVQILGSETPHDVAGIVLNVSKQLGVSFQVMEYLGEVSLGTTRLARFRVDCGEMALPLDKMLCEGRGVVGTLGGGYVARLPGGRKGTVTQMAMLAASRPNDFRAYRGTLDAHWPRQFDRAS